MDLTFFRYLSHFKIFSPHQRWTFRLSSPSSSSTCLYNFYCVFVNTVVDLHFLHEENNFHCSTSDNFEECARRDKLHYRVFIVWNARWEAFLSLPSPLRVKVVSINQINRRYCRDCRRDKNSPISAKLVAAAPRFTTTAAIVATGAIIWKQGFRGKVFNFYRITFDFCCHLIFFNCLTFQLSGFTSVAPSWVG